MKSPDLNLQMVGCYFSTMIKLNLNLAVHFIWSIKLVINNDLPLESILY